MLDGSHSLGAGALSRRDPRCRLSQGGTASETLKLWIVDTGGFVDDESLIHRLVSRVWLEPDGAVTVEGVLTISDPVEPVERTSPRS